MRRLWCSPRRFRKKWLRRSRSGRLPSTAGRLIRPRTICSKYFGWQEIGLDQRLMNPLLPDDPNSKLNACVGNVFRIWEEGKESRLTQLLFCDMSTPKMTVRIMSMTNQGEADRTGRSCRRNCFHHDADNEVKKKSFLPKCARVRCGCCSAPRRRWGLAPLPGHACGCPSPGCGLASFRYDTEKWAYHPSGQPKQRGADLPVCDGKHF